MQVIHIRDLLMRSVLMLGLLITQLNITASALELTVNEGQLITLPVKAKTVFIANPNIASYQVPAANKIFVFGLIPGTTSLYALDHQGNVIFNDKLKVMHDTKGLNQQIATLYPKARVKAQSHNGQLLLKGHVPTAQIAKQVMELANSFNLLYLNGGSDASSGDKSISAPINQLTISQPNQVNIRVKIAEVSRNVTTKLGLRPTTGMLGFENANWAQTGNGESSLNLNTMLNKLFGIKLQSHSIMLDALAKEGAAKLLAEPNLTAVSGETASFLAGGEYPVPVSKTLDGSVLVEYKEYGVLLNITPTVLSDQRISLKIQPEVSSLDVGNAVEINGLIIPGIKVRRADTTVEIASGESFMLAGLLMNDEANSVSKFPFLGDIPVLGSLFRSTAFKRKETELVIIAQAYVVEPSAEDNFSLPTDNYIPLSDLERLLNFNWQSKSSIPALSIDQDQPRLLGDNGFYY